MRTLIPAILRTRREARRPAVQTVSVAGTYPALAISNEMTAMGMRRSSMGHNKMVQIVQGTALALGRTIVVELPEVWRYGPVLRSLYLIKP